MNRLWVLGALRRPVRAIVIVVTLAVMSTATVGSLVAADSLSSLFTQDANAEWGAVDVEGHAFHTSVFDDALGRYLYSQASGLATAGAPRLVLPSAVEAHGLTVQGLALGLGPEEEGFPALRAMHGSAEVEGAQPADVLVNARLANRLLLTVGDPLQIVVAAPEWSESRSNSASLLRHPAFAAHLSARVAGVVADAATADLHRTPNVLISRSTLQRVTQLEPGKSTVLDMRAAVLGKAGAKALIDHLDPVARRAGIALEPVKQDSLDTASGEGGLFRSLLIVLALLVLLAAVGGTIDLVLSLVRERGTELAQWRAAGASRQALQTAVVVEAAVYGIVGGLLGAALALPFGHVVATALADHLASLNAGRGREQVHLIATVRPATVVIGVLVVVVTACLAGRAAGRRALSAEPDQLLRGDVIGMPSRSLTRPVLLLALGSAAIGAGGGALLFLGLTLVLASLWLWQRRRRKVDQRAAALGLVWSVAGAALLGDFSQGVQAGFGVLAVAGEAAVVCATVLVLPDLRRIMGVLRLYAGRGPTQLALLSAGAQAERGRDRSGVGISVVAGAIFGVVALSVLGSAEALPVARQSGGFAALGTAVADVNSAAIEVRSPAASSVVAVPHAVLPERDYRIENSEGKRMTVPYPVRLVAAEPSLVSQQQWGLAASLGQYRTAGQALTAVITDGDKAVVDRYARPEGAQPGDDVVLDLGAGPRRFRLIAVLDTFLLNGVFIGDAAFRDQGLAHGNTFVLARGNDPKVVAMQVEAAGSTSGLVMKSAARVAADVVAVNRSFTDIFALMVALALVVVVASMSAGIVRAARERRGELAVFRALGLDRRRMALVLSAEPLLITVVGEAIGAGVGVSVLWVLFSTGFSDLPFVLDAVQLGLLLLTTAVVAALACVTAAYGAARRIGAEDLVDLG